MTVMGQEDLLRAELVQLRQEHRALDERIVESEGHVLPDRLHLQRLKKRKLFLRDRIARLEDQLYPDIIA